MPSPRPRLTLATVMILVITAATASALYAQVYRLIVKTNPSPLDYDLAAVFVAAIALTAVALASRKGHSGWQAMLQINLAYLGYLGLIGVAEWKAERPLIYWYQATFALLVAAPLFARRQARRRLERGPRRTWWLQTTEAVAFAFLNMHLVLAGLGVQFAVAVTLGQAFFK